MITGRRAGWALGLAMVIMLAWRLVLLPRMGISLYVDEAQYWNWAKHLDWGYFSKPPGVAGLIALTTSLFGDGLVGVKIGAMACYTLAAGLAWDVTRRLYGDQPALWAGLAVLTLPMYAWLGLFVSTDALLTLFWMAVLWAYLRAMAQETWGRWLLLGGICGLGLMSKYTMIACMLGIFGHLLTTRRQSLRSAKPWGAVLLALVILAPNLIWNVLHDFPTLKHTADITVNKRAGGGWQPLVEFLAGQWLAMGPLLGSAFLYALVRRGGDSKRLFLWFCLPLWAVVSIQALKSNANVNWAAPALAPAAILAVISLWEQRKAKMLTVALVLNLGLVAVGFHWSQLLQLAQVAEASKRDPYTRARGWDELGRQLVPLVAAHPQAVLIAENRTLLSHMLYELRDQNPAYAAWNPLGRPSDHYKLTTDLRPYQGRDAVLVTQDDPAPIVARFARSEKLADLAAPLDETHRRTMAVYLLHDFQGY